VLQLQQEREAAAATAESGKADAAVLQATIAEMRVELAALQGQDSQRVGELSDALSVLEVTIAELKVELAALQEQGGERVGEQSSALAAARQRAYLREVFDHHADSEGELSASALIAALMEVQAPVLASESSYADDLFLRADNNLSGTVDFTECEPTLQRFGPRDMISHILFTRFMRVAQLPE